MSAPSDPPPSSSEHLPDAPPPMSIAAALGWVIGVTVALHLINSLAMLARPGSDHDLVRFAACQAIAYLLGLFAILRVHAPEASIRDFLALRRTHVALYPLGLLLGASLWLPAEVLLERIEKRWPLPGAGTFAEELFASSSPRRLGMLLAVIAVGPLVEEILFRGALFRALGRLYPRGVVIGVTAALFALVHQAPQVMVPIGLMAVALGYLRHKSGSLVPGVLAHATFNGVTCALLLWRGPGAPDPQIPGPIVIASTVAAALILVLIRVVGARSMTALTAQELDQR